LIFLPELFYLLCLAETKVSPVLIAPEIIGMQKDAPNSASHRDVAASRHGHFNLPQRANAILRQTLSLIGHRYNLRFAEPLMRAETGLVAAITSLSYSTDRYELGERSIANNQLYKQSDCLAIYQTLTRKIPSPE
jgi:hypothetical protein